MEINGNEDHSISLAQAAAMTKNYRDVNPPEAVIAHYFGKQAVIAILEQADCVGLRIYRALNDEGVKHVVLVGVDAAGNDLYNGLLAEKSYNCPPQCSAANPLNSNV